jgi:hypothetical protein
MTTVNNLRPVCHTRNLTDTISWLPSASVIH